MTVVVLLLTIVLGAQSKPDYGGTWVLNPVDSLTARLDAQTHRRTLKTHTPADGIPWYPDASYIVVGRDGRDAFMSYWNHWHNMHREHLPHLAASRTVRDRDVR